MTDKELKKLKRAELLQLLLTQSREIDRLRNELDEANKKLEDRSLGNKKAGSLAEAALEAYNIIGETQKAADLYLENVRRRAEQLLSSLNPENARQVLEALEGDRPAGEPEDAGSLEEISMEVFFDEEDDEDDEITRGEDGPSYNNRGVSF